MNGRGAAQGDRGGHAGAVVDAVDELLLLQRGKELGYKVTDEQFKRVLENIRKENKLENDEQFQAALKQEGMTHRAAAQEPREADDHQPGAADRGGRQDRHHRRRGAARTTTTHKNEFTTPASSRCASCSSPCRRTAQGRQRGRRRGREGEGRGAARGRRAGEAFAKLAAEVSDAPSKANGGLVGPLTADELDPGVRKLIEALKPGDVTDVFRTAAATRS